jgi:tRNA pseudouridine38-40 synthase
MTRWKCICAYDGKGFSGWQSQAKGGSVQDAIESRLAEVLGKATRVHASGRTDAGVHAAGQVFHFDADWTHGPDKLAAGLRHRLDRGIQIISVRAASPKFHSRFSATGKVYEYHLHLGDADPFRRPYCWVILKPLDLGLMRAAARVLTGKHDFKAFSALNGSDVGEGADTVRDLRRLEVVAKGRNVRIVAEADGFLYKMARSIAGALVSVGEGRLSPTELRSILESRVRTPRIQTAPPQGLFLRRVKYR